MNPFTSSGVTFSQTVSIQLETHACYRALLSNWGDRTTEPCLGGNLIYSGELDAVGSIVMVAGNIAGSATFAVTGDGAEQKRSIRNGIADFVVTSLDEALRILKNEIRKRNSVAVCIGSDRDAVEREMIERGVVPDVVFAGVFAQRRKVTCFGEHVRELVVSEPDASVAILAWSVVRAAARWMPKLDAIALECLANEPCMRRWIRLSPRYFGRANLGERAFYCEPEPAREIVRRFAAAIETGAIASEVQVNLIHEGASTVLRLHPPVAG